MTSTLRNDIFIGLFLVLIALLGLFVIIPNGVMSPGDVDIAALSPDFWPNIIMGGLAFAGATILLRGLIHQSQGKRPLLACPKRPGADPAADAGYMALLRVILCIAGMFLYYWSIQHIGIIVSSSLAIIAFTLLGGERRYGLQLAIAILLPLGLYYFFTYAANIPLPLGVFESWR